VVGLSNYLDRVRWVDDLSALEQLALRDVSYSRLNTILDPQWGCDLKYFYQYILKYPGGSNQAAILGNIIHEALEKSVFNDQPLDEVTLFSEFEYAQEKYDPDNEIDPEIILMGKRMLREYFERHKKDKYSSRISIYPEILGKELAFEIVISTGKIRGYIDFVYKIKDTVYVVDYKSGKHEVAEKNIPTNTQLGIYALVMKKLYPDHKIHGGLYYLKSAKLKSHLFTDEDLAGIVSTLEGQINDLVDKIHFKPTENERVCYYCTFAEQGICPTGKARLKRKSW
jgi:ATP-dependent exoDNAse (exonuclease V) beta subunit